MASLSTADKAKLSSLYHDLRNPTAFTSIAKLHKASGLPIDKVRQFLSTSDVYSLHRPYRKKFPRKKVVSSAYGQDAHADLADMQKIKASNDGHGYFLLMVDCYSRSE